MLSEIGSGKMYYGGDIVIDVPTTEPKLGLGSVDMEKGHKRCLGG